MGVRTASTFCHGEFGLRSAVAPRPTVSTVAVALKKIGRHLVAEAAAEANQQRDRRETEDRKTLRFLQFGPGDVEAARLLADAIHGKCIECTVALLAKASK